MILQTTIEIIVREKESRTLYEAAKNLGGIYLACELFDYGLEILYEARQQIITGLSTPGNKLGFKIDTKVGRINYVFLVAFEETLRRSVSISYSQIMTDLLTETILYESYTRSTRSGVSVEVTLTAGARLRAFLVTHSRKDQVEVLEKQLLEIFLKKWGQHIKTRREVIVIFHRGLLEELGKERAVDILIGNAACISGNNNVHALLQQKKVQEAYDVALCAFEFINHRRAYHNLENVGHGFKLSAYMAGRGLKHHLDTSTIQPELRAHMLDLSRRVIREVLQACKDSNIDFIRLQLVELNDLVGLLGEQQNYTDLEVGLVSLLPIYRTDNLS